MPATTLPRLKMCKDCSELAIAADGRCQRHTRSRRVMSSYSARPMPTPTVKNPIGMELECVVEHYHQRASVCSVAPCVCPDGSLGENGLEIKTVADAKRIGDRGADIAQRAHLAGGKVNRTCGFHVHLSNPKDPFRNHVRIGHYHADNLLPYVRGMEASMYNLIPSHRRDNTYCRPVTCADSLFSHYSWLSISERVPTIEVRLHPGTLNPWKVKAWADVCIGLQEILHSILGGEPSKNAELAKTGRFIETFPAKSLARKYLQARLDSNGTLTKFGFR